MLSAGPNRAAEMAAEVSQSKSSHPSEAKYHSDHNSSSWWAQTASLYWQHLFGMIFKRLSVREKLRQWESFKLNILMTLIQQPLHENKRPQWTLVSEETLYRCQQLLWLQPRRVQHILQSLITVLPLVLWLQQKKIKERNIGVWFARMSWWHCGERTSQSRQSWPWVCRRMMVVFTWCCLC